MRCRRCAWSAPARRRRPPTKRVRQGKKRCWADCRSSSRTTMTSAASGPPAGRRSSRRGSPRFRTAPSRNSKPTALSCSANPICRNSAAPRRPTRCTAPHGIPTTPVSHAADHRAARRWPLPPVRRGSRTAMISAAACGFRRRSAMSPDCGRRRAGCRASASPIRSIPWRSKARWPAMSPISP